jgi:hypothetical protein
MAERGSGSGAARRRQCGHTTSGGPIRKEARMDCTRRIFLTAASGLALGTRLAAASVQGVNDRVRIGVIGTGGRARSQTSSRPLPVRTSPPCATCPRRIAESERFNQFASLSGLAVRDRAILVLHLLATLARLAVPAAPAPWWPNPCSSSSSCSSSIGPANGHPIFAFRIAQSPACVRSSCAQGI